MRYRHLTALAARLALCLLLLPAPASLALDTDLPDLGNSAGSLMTPKRERELGQAFMRSVRQSQEVMDDPLLTEYVQRLGQRLVDNSGAKGESFHFFLIDNPQINAFAGPGGYIGVYSGLLLTTETESELAAVLAHEIAHVTQQHLLRTWESTSRMSIPNAAILLAAIALGVAVGGDAAAAAAIGGQAAMIQQRINFTRANEKEADRVGIEILAESGFEPRAMPSFFARMGKANRVYAASLPEYLQTHPVTTSRTADALGRADRYPYRQTPHDLEYQLARINLLQRRIEVPSDAIRELGRMLADGRYRSEAAVRYGIALAQIRARQYDDAAAALDRLLSEHPGQIEFVVSRAQVEHEVGRSAQALERLAVALERSPGSLALNLTAAETALASGRPQYAEELLQRFVAFQPDEPGVYRLLARAAADNKKTGSGHEYLAEYYYRIGDISSAVTQIEIALKQPGLDFFETSRLESRLAALREEEQEQERRNR
jgi:predicted Zn-dependent protease